VYSRVVKRISGVRHPLSADGASAGWDFLTNHAHVLICIASDPGVRLRDIAGAVGITERATQRIVAELVREGYVMRERRGRRNHYEVVPDLPLRHPLVQEREVGDLLDVLIGSALPAAGADDSSSR